MTMIIHDVQQGTAGWHALRAQHFTASEAPAMMGVSPYLTRSELLKRKAMGIPDDEIDSNKAALFKAGHDAEKGYRPIAEDEIGDDLYPVTGTLEVQGLPLLSSFDGLTLGRDIGFEHKLWSSKVVSQLQQAGEPAPHHYWQLEQQLLVSGADRIMFVTSDGTAERSQRVWYESKPERRAALIAGWKQFQNDMARYAPTEIKERPPAEVLVALPALVIHAKGEITTSNMKEYGAALAQRLSDARSIVLVTDQDFSNAKSGAKLLRDEIQRANLVKEAMLEQTLTVGEAVRMIDAWCEDMRLTALQLEKDVEREDKAKKSAMVAKADSAYAAHVQAANERLAPGRLALPHPAFAEAIKGKRNYASMQDAVDTMLASAKIAADTQAALIQNNRDQLRPPSSDEDWIGLFPDFAHVGTKSADDFHNLVTARVSAEQRRKDQERERIRKEEAERADQEARARLQAEAQATQAAITQGVEQGQVAAPLAADLGALAAEKAGEAAAAIDARQVIGAVQARSAAPVAEDDSSTITLGRINTLLAPIKLDAAGLEALGFAITKVKGAVHFPASLFPMLCRAVAKRAVDAATAGVGAAEVA